MHRNVSAFARRSDSHLKGEHKMQRSSGFRLAALTGAGALALSLFGVSPLQAAAGDWTNVSALPPGSGYPEISTGAIPSLKVFGDRVQVAWAQRDGTNDGGIYVAELNKNGALVTGPSAAVRGSNFNNYPQLLSYQGQRALSFGGNPAGSPGSRGQNLATSADGVTWTVNPGSLSSTNLADVSSGGGTVEAQSPGPNTLIWAGAPNLGSVVWHVGLSPTNPAQDPDGRFQPPTSGASGVNVTYEASTQKTYAAFYIAEGGTFYAEIAPNYSTFNQVPGAADRSPDAAGSIVPLAARNQGGVFIAFKDPAGAVSSNRGLIVREINSGRTWNIPGSLGASNAALGAAPNGRVWLSFERGSEMYVAQTDPGANDFGAPFKWGSPEKNASIYKSSIAADNSGAYVGVGAYAGRKQNIWAIAVQPSLTIDVVGRAQAGKTVTVRIRDGGTPVRNARVKVGNKTLKSGKGGLLKFKAPRAASVKITASGPGYVTSSSAVSLR
jgi:hypothetical protein